MGSGEVAGLDWGGDRILPAFQAPQHLDVYDMRGASREVQLAATTLAGLANRPQPRVYLINSADDQFWLTQAFAAISQNVAVLKNNDALQAILVTYRSSVQGAIVYDPGLIDTVNVATTLAGQRDGIVASPELARTLQQVYGLPVLEDLRNHKWRTRAQAYDWARHNLLSGASARLVAGLDPTNVSGLRSFLIATRTFVYWLDSRKHLPKLSSNLLSERALMQAILGHFSSAIVHLGWFIAESSGVSLTSQAGIPVLASDFFFNLETWTAVQPQSLAAPKQAAVDEVPSPTTDKVYVSFTMSDGDNLQYCQHRMLHLWRDSNRGSLPIGWTLSPTIVQAAPAMANYYMSRATRNDELIAGPSGLGYIFPSRWPAKRLTSFLQRTGQLMQIMNMSTLQVLDTDFLHSAGLPVSMSGMAFTNAIRYHDYVQVLHPFGLRGILSGAGLSTTSMKHIDSVPVLRNLGLASDVAKTVRLVKNAASAYIKRPLFLNVYILAWSMTPSDLKQVVQQLGSEYELVLPKTLWAMLSRMKPIGNNQITPIEGV
ncbi:MAG: hypothetical protein JO202_13205 [Ktedonobacteraceae bacterium]|nr:hypothetical protein [Ktedonobacteraceae bacterium]